MIIYYKIITVNWERATSTWMIVKIVNSYCALTTVL